MDCERWSVLTRRQPELVRMVHRFQFRPATYIDDGHLGDWLPPQSLARLTRSPRGEQRLSDLIRQRFNLVDDYADFLQPRLRLALLDATTWQRLLDVATPVMVSPLVSREIRRDHVLRWKQTLGDTGYLFAIKRASTLVASQTLADLVNGLGPELSNHALGLRWRLLEFCYSGEAPTFTSRLRLKFPRDAELNFDRPPEPQRRDAAWRVLKKLLLSEVEPEWAKWLE